MAKYPLLIEISSEDLPPAVVSFIKNTGEQFSSILEKFRVDHDNKIHVFATPRRIALILESVSDSQRSEREKVVGPPLSIAVQNNKPTSAGTGFAKKMGVKYNDLKIEPTKKGEYLCAVKEIKGKALKDILQEIVLEYVDLINANSAITMGWPSSPFNFPRPVRSIYIRYGKKNVRLALGSVKNRKLLRGHQVFSKKLISLEDVREYDNKMMSEYVIGDADKRKKRLVNSVNRVLLRLQAKALIPDKLLEEVNNSLEYPTAVRGTFPEKYLELPRDIIESCLIYHQKFFPVEDSSGKLLNSFIGVRDGISEFIEPIRKGYERVLIARLNDAAFFYKKDRQKKLRDYTPDLEGIEFTRGLGSLLNKINRMKEVSGKLTTMLGFDAAVRKDVLLICKLCKSDLATGIVGEFPELEGRAGRIYAGLDGEKKNVADAVFQHYLPRFSEDILPKLDEAAVVGLADRLDSLCGNIGTGVESSGSKDPFGLRRTCRGIFQILSDKKWHLDLDKLIRCSVNSFKKQSIIFSEDNTEKLKKYIRSMLVNFFEEQYPHDTVRCIMYAEIYDLADLEKRAKAVQKVKKSRDFVSIISIFKRINNIIRQAESKGLKIPGKYSVSITRENAEKALIDSVEDSASRAGAFFAEKKYYEMLKVLSEVRPAVDNFFEEVLVMDPDKKLMLNRLAILKKTVECFSPIGDVSKLEVIKK